MATSENAPAELALARANNYLAINLHRLLTEENANVFFSPFNLYTAMAMVFCAAEGQTESEMRHVLGYNDAGKVNVAATIERYMSSMLGSQKGHTLTFANAMLFQDDLEVKEDYKSLLTKFFKPFLMAVDFQNDTYNAVIQINDWVKEKTNGMIPTLIESLDTDTLMVLLNAVYFKGKWMEKFDLKATSPGNFFNYGDRGKAKVVNMMNLEKEYRYTENYLYQALELPYVGEDIAMVVLLPRSMDKLKAVEASLTPSFVSKLRQNMWKRVVNVTIPRFRLEYSKSLVPFFKRLGIHQLFTNQAQLDDISNLAKLKVSDIFHKAVLEVNEEGSEAAAATMVRLVGYSLIMSEDPDFTVDHPFVFFIYDTKSRLILFMGRVEEL